MLFSNILKMFVWLISYQKKNVTSGIPEWYPEILVLILLHKEKEKSVLLFTNLQFTFYILHSWRGTDSPKSFLSIPQSLFYFPIKLVLKKLLHYEFYSLLWPIPRKHGGEWRAISRWPEPGMRGRREERLSHLKHAGHAGGFVIDILWVVNHRG